MPTPEKYVVRATSRYTSQSIFVMWDQPAVSYATAESISDLKSIEDVLDTFTFHRAERIARWCRRDLGEEYEVFVDRIGKYLTKNEDRYLLPTSFRFLDI